MDENTNNEEIVKSIPDKAEEIARNYFRVGLNCSECVLLGFMDTHETDLPKEILTLATGFGMGIGNTKNMCGAISGAIMALGLAKGRKDPFALETPKDRAFELREVYPHFAEIVKQVEDKYGSLICSEISSPHGEFDGKPRKKNCQEIIGFCAKVASECAET